MSEEQADILILGGGIVGLATAYRLMQSAPDQRIVLLEKEERLAAHQTGHNSGVLHSGIYYKPGSLKAINCRNGKRAMEAFCAQEGIPLEICGKVIVAVTEKELPSLERILERGKANGVDCQRIDRERLRELEPHANGIAAIHVPEAGIVDYRAVSERLAQRIAEQGHRILTGTRAMVFSKRDDWHLVETNRGAFKARFMINCTGLHCDRTALKAGAQPQARIVPFRGEYYRLRPEAHRLCRNLIYPVPDPSFPFLGVHFTRMIDGSVECGPNAVLAFAREGYTKTQIDLRDLFEALSYSGFIRLAARQWRTGLGELWRSFNKTAFVKALQRLVPEIQAEDLESAPAGVRAQALLPNGQMVEDFEIVEHESAIHVLNAPSPAATSSLNIGQTIVERLAPRLRR